MTCAVLWRASLACMDDVATHDTAKDRTLLDDQLRLLEARRGEVEVLTERGDRAGDSLLNDLVGARLVVRSVLLGGIDVGGLSREERCALEDSEREARGLLLRAAELAQ